MQLPIHWDQKHLIAFLYIFLADSDFKVPTEEAISLSDNLKELLVGKYLMSQEDTDLLIAEVKNTEKGLDDHQRMETIRILSETVPLDWDIYQYVIKELDEIAHSDKYVSVEEHSLMYYIRLKFKKDYQRS